ncbi:MAG: exodeoxyribonuclease III [Rhodomicrobium sp.]|nr:MAG: exodeoxyribonuclease III [Rhodomicrobium sp.]
MKIATWNINGIKARINNLERWLKVAEPDIACLQEIKSVEENFPAELFEAMGYNVAVFGQKSFNGVAILSKKPFDEVIKGLPGDDTDEQARYLEAVISVDGGVIRVASIYLPNGNPVESEKYPYKLAWMERLRAHAKSRLSLEEPLILAGDYNVIPTEQDVYDASKWVDDALFLPQSRAAYQAILNLGLTSAFEASINHPYCYTFWDYQRGSWNKDHGIRIDHILLSPQAADKLETCQIDRPTRGWEKPSDHVPIWIDLAV